MQTSSQPKMQLLNPVKSISFYKGILIYKPVLMPRSTTKQYGQLVNVACLQLTLHYQSASDKLVNIKRICLM